MHRLTGVVAIGLLAACDGPGGNGDGGTLLPKPQVFLTLTEANVIGEKVRAKVNVTGCKAVQRMQLLESGSPIFEFAYTQSPTDLQLEPGTFRTLWNRLGLAATMALSARVTCDDERTNTSQPAGLVFFPVASRFTLGGAQALPDSFVAEGGLGGGATTFLGCVGTSTGTALGRASSTGQVIAYNDQLPFSCSVDTEISARSPATGTRWVLQPGRGAYVIDGNLNIRKVLTRKFERMGVGATGTAIFWENETLAPNLWKVEPPLADGGVGAPEWVKPFAGIMNSTPIVDTGNAVVWASSWQMTIGSGIGDVVAFRFNALTGELLNAGGPGVGPPVLVRQTFGDPVNTPIIPNGAFNVDGSLFYVPVLTDATGIIRSTVYACSTATGGCQNAARRWVSRTFDGIVNLIVPFDSNNKLAAVGPYQAWFLDTQGVVKNLQETAIRPTGSLQILGVQPGLTSEVYLLDGPVAGENQRTYPTEMVAIDSPEKGELYRFSYGGGTAPADGLYIGIDEAAQAWYRVGVDTVKPLSLSEYRAARGATLIK